jgi:hypothetical protein
VEQKRRAPKPVIVLEKRATRKVEEDLINSLSTDELWALHQKVAATLVAKITAGSHHGFTYFSGCEAAFPPMPATSQRRLCSS